MIRKFVVATVLAAAFVTMAPSQALAQRGTEHSMQSHPIKTSQDIDALKPGDLVAMSCPKCKDVTFSYVDTGRGANNPAKTGTKHTCPACKTTIETTGSGKAASDAVKHVCSKCGSDMAYCCAVKKGDLTKGMEPSGARKP